MKKIIGLLLVILVLAGGGYYYWSKTKEPAADAAAAQGGPGGPGGGMPVVTKKVTPREIIITINAVGSLIAGESADIHAEIAGQIAEILFAEGQPVKKGDVLLQIDTSLMQTELSKAKAAYEASSATFGRDDKLKNSGYVSNQKWDLSKSDLQTSKAAVENARITLAKATIRAPFDGIAGLRNFSVGDYAQTGQTLTTIDSIDPLKIEFSVPERSYSEVKAGNKIKFTVDAWANETFEGEIYALDSRIDSETRNFRVKANIPNPDGRLRPGMYARIDIMTMTRPNVLMVPEEAIIPQGQDSFVYTIEEGKAAMKKITTGIRQNGEVEAVDGLAAGAEVITAGNMKIGPGMPVMALPPAPLAGTAPTEGTAAAVEGAAPAEAAPLADKPAEETQEPAGE